MRSHTKHQLTQIRITRFDSFTKKGSVQLFPESTDSAEGQQGVLEDTGSAQGVP